MRGSKSTLFQFIKFCVVGVSNMIVNLAVYYIVVLINRQLYLLANVLAWIISVLNAFYWNNRVVFIGGKRDWKSVLIRLVKTYILYAGTMLLSMVLLHFEVEDWGISELVAPIINIFISTPVNYVISKFWAFREKT